VYGYGTRKKLTFNLRQHTTVFQAEAYAIKSYAVENVNWAIEIETFIFYPTVNLQFKLLTITRYTQNWYGTAINALQNWLNITNSMQPSPS
jgi:hypothetical protein